MFFRKKRTSFANKIPCCAKYARIKGFDILRNEEFVEEFEIYSMGYETGTKSYRLYLDSNILLNNERFKMYYKSMMLLDNSNNIIANSLVEYSINCELYSDYIVLVIKEC